MIIATLVLEGIITQKRLVQLNQNQQQQQRHIQTDYNIL
jgi:hypothetical protein